MICFSRDLIRSSFGEEVVNLLLDSRVGLETSFDDLNQRSSMFVGSSLQAEVGGRDDVEREPDEEDELEEKQQGNRMKTSSD